MPSLEPEDTGSFDSDLRVALAKARGERPCPLCEYISTVEPESVRNTLTEAAAGILGIETLVKILQRHKVRIGRRVIERHRNEGHRVD